MPHDEQAIRDLLAAWHTATAAGDLPQLLRLMADDVVFLVAGQSPMRGREAFATGFAQATQRFQITATGDAAEITVSGDWAFGWTHLAVAMIPRDGGATICRAPRRHGTLDLSLTAGDVPASFAIRT